jgi:hypothetical protein
MSNEMTQDFATNPQQSRGGALPQLAVAALALSLVVAIALSCNEKINDASDRSQ